uniref:Protein kinase domain-containing protein n=1 Tax=Leersia perrieri TaxID=77586 RepID=A0A0D9WTW9_9ORYZ
MPPLFLGLAVAVIAMAAAAALPAPSCPTTCGGVAVEYPFGVGANCSLSKGFSLQCAGGELRLRLGAMPRQTVKVLDVDLRHGKLRTTNAVASMCVENNTSLVPGLKAAALPYRFSDKDNRFFAFGCSGAILFNGSAAGFDDVWFISGCFTTCFGNNSIRSGSCSGIGCCETAIPRSLNSYSLIFGKLPSSGTPVNSRCIYAVLMEAASFRFEAADATTDGFIRRNNNGKVPVVLNFAVGNETCKEAQRRDSYACIGDHSVCVDAVDGGSGYLCNCSQGYTGNPYLPNGCIDVDECGHGELGCPDGMICINFPGGYNCLCPEGQSKSNKSGVLICEPDQKRPSLPVSVITVIGVSGGLVIVVISILIIYLERQRRALANVKRKYFERHGGLLLYEELSSRQQGKNAFTIYTEEQLEQVTNGFDDSNVIGRGGHATVYKGTVPSPSTSSGDLVVAIKRCKLMDERNKEEFGREMLILSQVNHKNIVKLLGCCLEVDVPMLVYEFIPNGTLYHLIHGGAAIVSYATRLRIAHESAKSLAYLQSFASPPILHGDVSDFGASILAPTDEAQLVSMVQGTCGYLDPEYMQTCQLTEKSDVYSFGVILLELLTGKKPLCLDGPEEQRSLSARFVAAMREKKVEEILDERVKGEASDESLEEITQLALECLHMCGSDRPTMKDVVERLGGLRKLLHQHPWMAMHDVIELEEERCLLHGSSSPEGVSFEVTRHTTDTYYTATALPAPGCPTTCGGVAFEYPFGVGANCSLSNGFSLDCAGGELRLRLGTMSRQTVKVLGVDLRHGKVRTTNAVASLCVQNNTSLVPGLNAAALPYRFNDEDNRFYAIGCSGLVFLNGDVAGVDDDQFTSGCITTCMGNRSIRSGSCSGIGCCETAIPRGLNSYSLVFGKLPTSGTPVNGRCIYAVLMEAASFRFEAADATTDGFFRRNNNGTVPLVLNFVVGNETCKEAQTRGNNYACLSDHSVCVDVVDGGSGYLCNCSHGYTGNPYLPNGCIGVSGGLVIAVMSILVTYLVRQRRALTDVKRKYFERHGGLLLYEELSSRQQGKNAFTIYTEEQLEQATNGFDNSNILGRGGHATVYKGIVPSSSGDLVVAIKRSKVMDEANKEEFGKEMLILSQVNHKNIVKLLGCCLEVEVPMLVYEFVPNGTLDRLIHGGAIISYDTRLRIAHESAESLAYLHSFASPPILHGDVKSSNILLDETFMAKVSDFGASIVVPTDEAKLATMVQGTYGYLDPEYMQTCQLTEKSDVYSFGVVLLELLTGKKPLCLDGPEEERSLAANFVAAMREKRVDEILDEQVKGEASDESLEEITQLALECLHMCGDDRPVMKDVAERLGRLRKLLHQHPWMATHDIIEPEEERCLLHGSPSPEGVSFEVTRHTTGTYYTTTS